MTKVQKLEIYFGLINTLVLSAYLGLLIWGFGLVNEVTGSVNDGVVWASIPWFLSLFVSTAAYFHVAKQSMIARLVLYFGAILIILISTFLELTMAIWGLFSPLGLLINILFMTPAVLAGITIMFALRNDISFSDH